MNVGTVIRRLRKSMKMTLEVLADAAGTDAGNLSRIERGIQSYTPEMLESIAKGLGTTASSLISEAEEKEAISTRARDRPLNDEQELLMDYRKLRSSSRSIIRLMVAEMARSQGGNGLHP